MTKSQPPRAAVAGAGVVVVVAQVVLGAVARAVLVVEAVEVAVRAVRGAQRPADDDARAARGRRPGGRCCGVCPGHPGRGYPGRPSRSQRYGWRPRGRPCPGRQPQPPGATGAGAAGVVVAQVVLGAVARAVLVGVAVVVVVVRGPPCPGNRRRRSRSRPRPPSRRVLLSRLHWSSRSKPPWKWPSAWSAVPRNPPLATLGLPEADVAAPAWRRHRGRRGRGRRGRGGRGCGRAWRPACADGAGEESVGVGGHAGRCWCMRATGQPG